MQAEFQTAIFDYKNNIEYTLSNIPDAVRVYPASAGTATFPQTPYNNWTTTILFCGGTTLNAEQWTAFATLPSYPANVSCVTISPDVDLAWYETDPLDSGRSMGNVSGPDPYPKLV
jgi:hypothetical protein